MYAKFREELDWRVPKVKKEVAGASDLLRFLKSKGIKTVVSSGLPHNATTQLVKQMGWEKDSLVDYVNSSDKMPFGRPEPCLIEGLNYF